MDVAEVRRLKELESENERLKRLVAEQLLVIDGLNAFNRKKEHPDGTARSVGSPDPAGVVTTLGMSLPGVELPVPAYEPKRPEKDRLLGEQLTAASREVPRFGYRRISAWLSLGESRVRRLWRALKLSIPRRRPRRRR